MPGMTRPHPAAPKVRPSGKPSSGTKKPRIVHKAVDAPAPVVDIGHHMHAMDMGRWFHGVLDEFEGRYQAGGKSSLRWDGEAWYGGDYNRLWLKSEGTMTKGRVHDGDQELLYSRAISTYFNFQGGVRLDLDSRRTRAWGAVGVEGLALYQFEVQATGYFSDRGVAARFEGSYDILLTNRLILQPQVELNLYSRADPRRQIGSGLADIDTGLRLRYEIWRKMAPYVAVTYDSPLTQGRHMVRKRGERASEARFTFGIRSWF
ncbi:copper resistance protein B [Bombella sp. TMW 2.2559]|uniref:Copper resistance protein B n=2 Tax=Bombella dulcis TaxID=2967339 RepID=A0ABT3WCN7_9PROT|nr:copper resistance protein B [Bombella dulcis]